MVSMKSTKPGTGKASLFDEDDDDDGYLAGKAAAKASTETLKVNEEYAKRLAHNKQREALHRLQELKKQGVVDSSDEDGSSDDESSDDGYIPAKTEVKILETLAKIKKKDPSIYSEDVKFFNEDDEDDDDEDEDDDDDEKKTKGNVDKKQKPVYLKDAIAKQLIEDASDFDEDEPKEKKKKDKKHVVTYSEEQQQLKDEFLRSVDTTCVDEEEDDGFLKLRKKDHSRAEVEEKEAKVSDTEVAQRLEDYFGRDDGLDENEKFLKEYLLNKRWVDEDANNIPSYEEIVGDIVEDEEELEKQDKFEAEYNFRFEEGMGSQVMGHSRIVEDSVRRKDDKRRQKRLKKEQRLSEAEFERREELKRLKNIKKKEIMEKLEKIRSVAGAKETDEKLLQALGDEELEEDFNPDEYDRKMREAFGEEYYGADDADETFEGYDMDDLKKPDFDAEDEVLGLPKDWDEPEGNVVGFSAARKKLKQQKQKKEYEDADEEDTNDAADEEDDDNDDAADEEEDDGDDDAADADANATEGEDDGDDDATDLEGSRSKSVSKRKKKAKISLREKLAFDKELEEYYKLDYEDMIGDLPTRFKYRQIKPNTYGLSTAQILDADDKELNQYVSLKKMAPYVTEEWKPKWKFHVSQKQRKKNALKKQSKDQQKLKTSSTAVDDKEEPKEVSAVSEESKKKKRKRRKKGLSLSESRLIAYGKIDPPKKKKKTA